MKHYFVSISWNMPKNKAHKALHEFIENKEHVVLDQPNLDQFFKEIKNKVVEINKEFTRCKDLEVRVNSFVKKEEIDHYSVWFETFTLSAQKINGFIINKPIQP